MDMLEWGEKYLERKRDEHMSRDVVYVAKEGTTYHVKAAVGQHFYRSSSVDGISVGIRSVDFIVRASDLEREPCYEDMIIYKNHRYVVNAPSGEPVFEWSGGTHDSYRIHTFCKGEDTLNGVVINTEV